MTLRREDKAYAGTEKEAPDFDLEGFRDDTVSTDCMTLVYGPDGTGKSRFRMDYFLQSTRPHGVEGIS